MQAPSLASGLIGSILASAGVATVVSLVFKRITKGAIDAYFARQVKAYEAELAALAAAAKFDYARRLADFNLITAKRHAVYAGLYRRYRAAFDAYTEYGVRYHRDPGYKDLNETEITALMARKGVTAARQEIILALWASERSDALKKLHAELDAPYRQRARALLDRAQHFWLANKLYVSPHVNDIVQLPEKRPSLVNGLAVYARLLEDPSSDPAECGEGVIEERAKLEKDIRERFQILIDALRKELTTGDYDGLGVARTTAWLPPR